MSRVGDSTVIRMSIQRMVCTGCGAEANASCNCGVAYTPKSVRAAEAIKANPEKSDRAIAAELGVSHPTVAKAREQLGGNNLPPDKERVGRDGKSYSIRPQPVATIPPGQPPSRRDAMREQVRAALLALSGLPPAAEVAAYFRDTDASILVSERVETAAQWLNAFADVWRNAEC